MSPEYLEYIRSPEWKKKKDERLKIDEYRCCMCGRHITEVRSMQCHHVTYKRLGHEDVMEDICSLCGSCRRKLHSYYNRKRNL